MQKDAKAFGVAVRESLEAQLRMFPNMMPEDVRELAEEYDGAEGVLGYKISGAGGGGYLILVTDREVPKSLKVRIRRK